MGSAGGLWGAAVEAVGRGGGVILHLACVGWGGRKGIKRVMISPSPSLSL